MAPLRKKKEGKTVEATQWERRKYVSGKKVRQATIDKRLVRASRDSRILGFRNVKRFDDHGATYIYSYMSGANGNYTQPLHVYMLNANINDNPVNPARSLIFDDVTKKWKWGNVSGLDPAGVNTTELQVIKQEANDLSHFSRMFHEYTHVKLNCWGSKNKAVRWQIDVVTPLSDEVNPFHWGVGSQMNVAAMQAYEELVKHFTFNPIARIDHNVKKHFKVIKSISFILEPNSLMDGDSDPSVRTIDWFMRVNRVTNYDKTSKNVVSMETIGDADELKNAVNMELGQVRGTGEFPRDNQVMLLMIRASDYGDPATSFNNMTHASYDIDFRTKFQTLN